MSEPAPEVPRPRGPQTGGGLGKKLGPLPIWAWAGLLVGTIGFVLFIRSRTKGQGQVADTTPPASLPAQVSIFLPGGGPPAPPANGVVPPGSGGVPGPASGSCSAGFELRGGACVPVDQYGTPGPPPSVY